MMTSVFATATGIFATYLLLRALLFLTQDAKEPPTIENSIPFFSPMIQLWRKGSSYWNGPQSHFAQEQPLPQNRFWVPSMMGFSMLPVPQDEQSVEARWKSLAQLVHYRWLRGLLETLLDNEQISMRWFGGKARDARRGVRLYCNIRSEALDLGKRPLSSCVDLTPNEPLEQIRIIIIHEELALVYTMGIR